MAVLALPLERAVVCVRVLQLLQQHFVLLDYLGELLDADALVQRALGCASGLKTLRVELRGVQIDVEHFLEEQAVPTLYFVLLLHLRDFFFVVFHYMPRLSRLLELHDSLDLLESFHVEEMLSHDLSLVKDSA